MFCMKDTWVKPLAPHSLQVVPKLTAPPQNTEPGVAPITTICGSEIIVGRLYLLLKLKMTTTIILECYLIL